MPYVFGRLMNKTPRAIALSAVIQDYWISFINDLDPNDNHGQKRKFLRLFKVNYIQVSSTILGPRWDKYTSNQQVSKGFSMINTIPLKPFRA